MKNKLSIEEVKKISRLSALELSEDELKNFGDQFYKILEYFKLLDEVEISESEKYVKEEDFNIEREDKVSKSSVSPEHFSPYLENQFFKIPRVIDQEK